MAAEVEAYALAAVSQAPEPFRRLLESAFGYRPGIAQAADWAVSQNGTPNMSVNVAAGRGLVDGSESSAQGMYFCQASTVTNVVISASNPTNPRRDLIVGRIRDNEYATGPTSTFAIEVITGTPAASPSDPAAPANTLVIARVLVGATVTTIVNANITDLRTSSTGQHRLTALGGVVVCTSTTRPTVGLWEGLVIYETDNDREMIYDGTGWFESSTGLRTAIGASSPMGASFSLVTGASLTVPAGRWVVQAKGTEVQTGTGAQYDVRIRNTTDSTDLDALSIYGGTGPQRLPWALMGALTITATKTIRVEHMVGSLSGAQTTDNTKLWAMPVLTSV